MSLTKFPTSVILRKSFGITSLSSPLWYAALNLTSPLFINKFCEAVIWKKYFFLEKKLRVCEDEFFCDPKI